MPQVSVTSEELERLPEKARSLPFLPLPSTEVIVLKSSLWVLGALGRSLGFRDGCSSPSRESTELLPQFGKPFSMIPRCCGAQHCPAGLQCGGGGGSVMSKHVQGPWSAAVSKQGTREQHTQHPGNAETVSLKQQCSNLHF